MTTCYPQALAERFGQILHSRLVRQNLILFAGGLAAGFGSFAYHAVAGRMLGPVAYGEVASLIAFYGVGAAFGVIISLVLARYAAALDANGRAFGLITRTGPIVAVPTALGLITILLLAGPVSTFEHLGSVLPAILLGLSIALAWQLAIPRGILQGLQRFGALALNLALEPVVRTVIVVILLMAGYAVSGAIAAVLVALTVCLMTGIFAARDQIGAGSPLPIRLLGFAATVGAGIVGIQLMFNQDVVLAEHYLNSYDGGIYGALNKIGTIVFYLTLSISQVLFPRVVEATVKKNHPARILLSSVGILLCLGGIALLVFAVVPGLVVDALYGSRFRDATPYVFAVGLIGLVISLNNILVQFCLAVRDRVFIPILAAGCAAEAATIILFHASVRQVVEDVLVSLVATLILLSIRTYLLTLKVLAASGVEAEPALAVL